MTVTASETASHLRRRRAAAAAAVGTRAAVVQERLTIVAALLRESFGARRVWLFGSHATAGLHAESDVDLAVEGVSADRLDRAQAEVEAIVEGPVDLVRYESAASSLRARIDHEAREL